MTTFTPVNCARFGFDTPGGLSGLSATPTVSTILEGKAEHVKTGDDSPNSVLGETQVNGPFKFTRGMMSMPRFPFSC